MRERVVFIISAHHSDFVLCQHGSVHTTPLGFLSRHTLKSVLAFDVIFRTQIISPRFFTKQIDHLSSPDYKLNNPQETSLTYLKKKYKPILLGLGNLSSIQMIG